jgi:hypothetical protein
MIEKVSRTEAAKALADEISSSMKADVLVINGGIDGPLDHDLIKLVVARKRHPSVFVVLTTEGGDADAGFRIARETLPNRVPGRFAPSREFLILALRLSYHQNG